MNRRNFLKMVGISAGAVAAPGIVRAGILMPLPKKIVTVSALDYFHIDKVTGNIRYIEPSTAFVKARNIKAATVLEFHRWLQAQADDMCSAGDDMLDITDPNPSIRRDDQTILMDNGFHADESALKKLYGGSITQEMPDGGLEQWCSLRVEPVEATPPELFHIDKDGGIKT